MIIHGRHTNNRVFIIAEIGNNHEGDYSRAKHMINCAAETGVDAVKFQTFVAEEYVSSTDKERLKRLKSFQLSKKQYADLAIQATSLGLIFFSTPFDIESAYFLNSIQPLFKISSGDNNFMPLIETIAKFDKPTIISTGLADLNFLDTLYRWWSLNADKSKLAFLHCVASYPVPPEQANLAAISTLQSHFPEITVGYSDHTVGIDSSVYAVAAGAKIIEKHFTMDKNFSSFRDHQLSADPQDMKLMVEKIRQLELLLGSGEKEPQPCEKEASLVLRRSIAAGRFLPAGTTLRLEDLSWVRPGGGFTPGDENSVVGKMLNCTVERGEIIHPGMLLR